MSRKYDAPSKGPSQRQLRVGELIRRTLSEALMRGDLHVPEQELQLVDGARYATGNIGSTVM